MRGIAVWVVGLGMVMCGIAANAAEAPIPLPPVDAVKYAGLSPQEAVAAITLPPGFKAALVAGEPDVVQPVALAIDDRGRLWVAEANNYPRKAPPGEGNDRILIFEDTHGDGHFDKRTVFMDGLNLVSALEVGFGGVWVGQAPQLLFIPILDGDKPGRPQVLLDGFGFQDTHETLNNFAWGPDGWLYGCQGITCTSRVGAPGTPDEQRPPLNAGVWRYHPTRKVFEIYAEGGGNDWGLDWDDQGRAFMVCSIIPHLYQVIQGARYQRQSGQHFEPYTFASIKNVCDHVHWAGGSTSAAGTGRSDAVGGGHSHCGTMVYLGDNWPARYRNTVFMNNIHGNRMNNDLPEPLGSGVVAHHGEDFMKMNDRWARLICMKYGPDGGVYVIDWYDKQACHHNDPNVWDRSNGRIYKVTYGDAKPVKVDLAKLSSDELVKLQLHSNDWYVRHARRLLQERGPDAATRDALLKRFQRTKDPEAKLRALWALASVAPAALTETPLLERLGDQEHVRAWTVRLMVDSMLAARKTGELDCLMIEHLGVMAREDTSPVVRLSLASAMTRAPLGKPRWTVLDVLAQHAEDATDQNLPLMYWYAIEPMVAEDPARAAELATGTKIPLLREFISRRLAIMATDAEPIPALADLLNAAKDAANVNDVLKGLLDGLAGKRRVAMPAEWPAISQRLSRVDDADVRQRTQALSIVFGDPQAFAALRQTLADAKASLADRAAALQTLLDSRDASLVPLLQELLKDATLRGAAIRSLASYDDAKTGTLLLAAYPALDATEKRDALATLASRRSTAAQLLEALKSGAISKADLNGAVIRQLSGLDDAAINQWLTANWGTVRGAEAEKTAEIARLKSLLSERFLAGAKLENGRAVFAKTCMSCHTLFGVGAQIGPDLTGSNRSDVSYVIENVIDPSAIVAKDYLVTVFKTRDGRSIDGIIKAQTPDTLTIATVNEILTLPRSEIASQRTSTVSMMPEGLLATLSIQEIRDLVAYLRSPAQVPLMVTKDTTQLLFDGRDLSFWDVLRGTWRAEDGQLVGSGDGALASHLTCGDFRLTFRAKASSDAVAGLIFHGKLTADGATSGHELGLAGSNWGKLYDAATRGQIATTAGSAAAMNSGEWATIELLAIHGHLRVAIDGRLVAEATDPFQFNRGSFGVRITGSSAAELRLKELRLELNPADELATIH